MHYIFEKIKIISGGQTGADRAALDFAVAHNIPHGGWCPYGRLAEDAIIAEHYQLNETNTKLYIHRTYLNVRDSDGTLVFYQNEMDRGTYRTILFCQQLNKPLLLIDLTASSLRQQLETWIKENQIEIVNVAGSREENSPGIYSQTLMCLEELK